MVHVRWTTQNFVISCCCFAGLEREVQIILMHTHVQPLFCSLNLLFSNVPVVVAVMVFLNTLIPSEGGYPVMIALIPPLKIEKERHNSGQNKKERLMSKFSKPTDI